MLTTIVLIFFNVKLNFNKNDFKKTPHNSRQFANIMTYNSIVNVIYVVFALFMAIVILFCPTASFSSSK